LPVSSKKDAEPAVVKFKNDSERLKAEWVTLASKNTLLTSLLSDLATYIRTKFNKDLIITMIYRTPDEQAEIYKDDPKFKVKPFKSPHTFWHSADIRSSTFTPEEIKQIEDYLNVKYKKSNYYGWTARNHKVGNGAEHFHIQITKK
jgi:hypothetical protein